MLASDRFEATRRRGACEDARVSGVYSYVDGERLVAFLFELRDAFSSSRPYGDDDAGRPNSVRLVAIDIFESKTVKERLEILEDLLEVNPGLIVERGRDIFEYADTPTAAVTDLVCGIACQILARDPEIREQDHQRVALSVEPAEELPDEW